MGKNKTAKYEAPDNPYAYTVLQNLKDAGCTDEMAEKFMALLDSDDEEQQIKLLTKSRKKKASIRNDGVHVISGIFCRANACVCGKNAFPPRPLAANRQICRRSGRFVGKPKVCQRSEQIRLLSDHRKYLLEALHREEKQIDCLDYLLYRMQKSKADGKRDAWL